MPENTLDNNQIIFDEEENESDNQQELSLTPEKRKIVSPKSNQPYRICLIGNSFAGSIFRTYQLIIS